MVECAVEMPRKEHWEHTYAAKPPEGLGWYAPHLRTSLEWIGALSLDRDASIIDVGGGASTLVDDLLGRGFTHVTVLDLSERALTTAQTRLGQAAAGVTWIEGDVTSVALPSDDYDVWHDRAAFHFLTEPEDRQRYVQRLHDAVMRGGHVMMGTFGLEAPPRCSGLPVERYEPQTLHDTLGEMLALVRQKKEVHVTPGGVKQMYLYCLFRKVTDSEAPFRDVDTA